MSRTDLSFPARGTGRRSRRESLRRPRRRPSLLSTSLEPLESRALLAVSAGLNPSDPSNLLITVDSADAQTTAYVRLTTAGAIEVADNVSFLSAQSFSVAGLGSISATGAAGGSESLVIDEGSLAVSLQSSDIETVAFNNTASVSGNATLALSDGNLAVADLVTAASLSLSAFGGISLSGVISAADIAINSNGAIQQGASDSVTAGTVDAVTDGGKIELTGSGNIIGGFSVKNTAPGAAVSLVTQVSLVLGSTAAGIEAEGPVTVVAAGSITQAPGTSIVAPSLSVSTAVGDILLDEAGNTITSFAALNTAVGGKVSLANTVDLQIGTPGIVTSSGTVSLAVQGGITQAVGAAIVAGSLSVSAVTGVQLGDASNAFVSVAALNSTPAQVLRFVTSTSLQIGVGTTGISAAGDAVVIQAGGAVTQLVGTGIASDSLVVSTSSGSIDLSGDGNLIGAFAATNSSIGGAVALLNGTMPLVIGVAGAGISTVDGDITVVADGPITVIGPLSYGAGSLTLQSLSNEVIFQVSTGADSGSGSLRQAITDAIDNQADPQATRITFASTVAIVSISSALPVVSRALTFDGEGRLVGLDGSAAGAVNGLVFGAGSGGSRVQGLAIVGCELAAIRIEAAAVSVVSSYLGLTAGGLAMPNGVGVVVAGSTASAAAIGEDSSGNVISGNLGCGVIVEDGASATLLGNIIGLSPSGDVAVPNGTDGVLLDGSTAVTIGGASATARNVISGNAAAGVHVVGGASGTVIEGNWIGLTAAGDVAAGNGASGILLDGSDVSARIGSDVPAAGNVISGNGGNGIEVAQGSSANLIIGNVIGLDANGTIARGNAESGIAVTGASTINTIGQAGAGNRIAGNSQYGVYLAPASAGTTVFGNMIGLDANDAGGVGNALDGIFVDSAADTLISTNFVSGNSRHGIRILGAGANGTKVTGNFVGLKSTADGPLANASNGIYIVDVPNVSIGGGATDERNVVSGNGGIGIFVTRGDGTGSPNADIRGNFVGTDIGGTIRVANAGDGIVIDGVGSDNALIYANLVSGNAGTGIHVMGGANGAVVAANSVGVDVTREVALGNDTDGVLVEGGSGHRIGGSEADANVISGNSARGVVVSGVAETVIIANKVGTNPSGTLPIGNGSVGIGVEDSAGTTVQANLISGNGGFGIFVSGATTSDTLVFGNRIGTDARGLVSTLDGFSFGNLQDGVYVLEAASTTIGGASADLRNVVGGNAGSGVTLQQAVDTSIEGNYIGVSANGYSAVGNGGDGVAVIASANTSIVGRNLIAFNGGSSGGRGIRVSGAADTTIGDPASGRSRGNSIYRNAGDGVLVESDATGTVVVGNYVGTTPVGGLGLGNGGAGISIVNANGSMIGGRWGARSTDPLFGNLVVGNATGIRITGAEAASAADGNVLLGNTVRSNQGAGIVLESSSHQTVGGGDLWGANVVIRNGGAGVVIDNSLAGGGAGSGLHVVTGNAIGTDRSGSSQLGNAGDGIVISSSVGNLVGGTLAAGNRVAYNRNGILLSNAVANDVADGNAIGGNLVRGNLADGIRLEASDANAVGGSTADLAANVIVLNVGSGIAVAGGSRLNSVNGNMVGIDTAGHAGANARYGVLVQDSDENVVVGNTVAWSKAGGIRVVGGAGNLIGVGEGGGVANVVRNNSGHGVALAAGASGNTVAGNTIRGNGGAGVAILSASENVVNGGNVVIRNQKTGVTISGGQGNTVSGNYVGTNTALAAGLGNKGAGIVVRSSRGNVIGGVGVGNTVRFNAGNGIEVTQSTATGLAEGNLVMDNTVSANVGAGIALSGGGYTMVESNTIGGSVAGDGNQGAGVRANGARDGMIVGNTILGNLGNGVELVMSVSNQIGDNVVGLQSADGIHLSLGSNDNDLFGNFVGVSNDGVAPLPNRGDGVEINASVSNAVRTSTVAGNGGAGITIVSALAMSSADGNRITANTVSGNREGIAIQASSGTTVSDGNALTNNVGAGILVASKSSGTIIEGNEIALNGSDGVGISASGSTVVQNNAIHDNASAGVRLTLASGRSLADGNSVLGNVIGENGQSGVVLAGSSFNIIGASGGSNALLGNGGHGIVLRDGSNSNVLEGNRVGVDAAGVAGGNLGDGLRISASFSNVVRGGNLFSSNAGAGIRVVGSLASSTVTGNRMVGSIIEGNVEAGVVIAGGAHTLGGTDAGDGNTIRLNGGDGVALLAAPGGTKTPGASVQGNIIEENNGNGVYASAAGGYTIAANSIGGHSGAGVYLNASAGNRVTRNVIGGTSGANGYGVVLTNSSSGNTVAGNRITDNVGDGVAISGGRSSNNLVGVRVTGSGNAGEANVISGNGGAGIRVTAGIRNQLVGNSIFANLAGIALDQRGNGMQPAPALASAVRSTFGRTTQLQISGTMRGSVGQRVVIEFYSNDPTDGDVVNGGYQARVPIGRTVVTVGAAGSASFRTTFNANVAAGKVITAIATTASGVTGNSSQISAGVEVA